MDPLQTFKEIYGQVPDWVATMHAYAPAALQHYTDLRMSVMRDGALTRKEKELILVGVNAARRYETSMIYHTDGALNAGATVLEVADAVVTAVISRGLPAWLEGQKAVRYALDHRPLEAGSKTESTRLPLPDVAACETYYVETFGSVPEWAAQMQRVAPDAFTAYTNLRRNTLCDQHIPARLKELILVGINAAERYDLGVDIHVRGALAKGATKEQLAECFLTAVLTAGIPAWFMGWEHLQA